MLQHDLSTFGAKVITEGIKPKLTYWPHCDKCKSPFHFDLEGPFADCKCGTTEWGDPRPASWVRPPADEVTTKMANTWKYMEDFLVEYLQCWKDEGVPAPVNELQSISSWLRESCNVEEMQRKMRCRMVLLMNAASALNEQGLDAEIMAGIYKNRPDLEAEARAAYEEYKNDL